MQLERTKEASVDDFWLKCFVVTQTVTATEMATKTGLYIATTTAASSRSRS